MYVHNLCYGRSWLTDRLVVALEVIGQKTWDIVREIWLNLSEQVVINVLAVILDESQPDYIQHV
jgi:hypothetical protein